MLSRYGHPLPQAWKKFRFVGLYELKPPNALLRKAGFAFFLAPRVRLPRIVPISQAAMAALFLSETGKSAHSVSELVGVLSRLAAGTTCFTLVPGRLRAMIDLMKGVLS